MVSLAAVVVGFLLLQSTELHFTIGLDKNCVSADFNCFVYSWQTLIAGSIAFIGAVVTVRQMRRERRIDGYKQIAKAIGHALAASDSLRATRTSFANLCLSIEADKEPFPRSGLNPLIWEGTDFPAEFDPFLHNRVREAWQHVQIVANVTRRSGAPPTLINDDRDAFKSAIKKIDETVSLIEDDFIVAMVAELRKVGFVIRKDENGHYRYDRSIQPKF